MGVGALRKNKKDAKPRKKPREGFHTVRRGNGEKRAGKRASNKKVSFFEQG